MRLVGLAGWGAVVQFSRSTQSLTYAASIAFFMLVSLFPCLLLAFALLGRLSAGGGTRTQIIPFVLRYFPTHFDFVVAQLNAFHAGVTVSVTGVIALMWASLGVFGAISDAVNYAWGVEHQRSFLKQRLVAFSMLLLAGLLLLAALLLVSAAAVVQTSWFAEVLRRFPGLMLLAKLASRYAATLLLIGVVGLVFYYVPNAQVRFRDVWLGAILTGLAWKGTLVAFSWYVRDMGKLASVNGSITTVIVFLIWMYTSAIVLLLGTQFTAAHARLVAGHSAIEHEPAAPTPRR